MNASQLRTRRKRWKKLAAVLHELFPPSKTILYYTNAWELVVAVTLSAQTTDAQINKVVKKLFKKYTKLDDYCTVSLSEFEKDISSVNYYKNKARHILAAAQMLRDEFDGEVPNTLVQLQQLPGVGRKTANVVQSNWFEKAEGIAVDTHVRRFAIRFDLTDHDTPSKIEQDLLQIIPQNQWMYASHYMIDYGRTIAPARPYDFSQDPLVNMYPKAGKRFRV
ncbi:endonuclease III [Candidatus Nomurabacteria bacterium]|nr:endonuclease III [Candidatus Nomurabacteria bacterium]